MIHEQLAEIARKSVKEGDRLLLEYMKKRNLTFADLEGNVAMQNHSYGVIDGNTAKLTYWYKGELIFSITQKFDLTHPFVVRAEARIEKGDW